MDTIITLNTALPEPVDGQAPEWIHLTPAGTFRGRDGRGPFTVDPAAVVRRAPGRLPVVHLKDKEMAGQAPVMAPVGEGNLDWGALLPALEAAGTQWYAVEQDLCRRDPFECLASSFAYLTARLDSSPAPVLQ